MSKLAAAINKVKEVYRPEKMTKEEVDSKLIALYDEVADIASEYRAELKEDSPLAVYLNYHLRDPLTILNDFEEEPVLFATVPHDTGDPIVTKAGQINPFTTVRITHATELGDVGITVNLEAVAGYETRVMWDSLIRYRNTVKSFPEPLNDVD